MMDVLVIGGGPAGVSAGIYARRTGLSVTIVTQDDGALGKTELIENYYGFSQPVSGKALLEAGEKQAERLGATLLHDQIVSLEYTDGRFAVSCLHKTGEARSVVIATGAVHSTPDIEGLRQHEGQGVSYCAVCDAFFFRGKDVAVLGSGHYALHEAADLLPVASSVTLLTNGAPIPAGLPEGLRADSRRIRAILGEDRVQSVAFERGDPLLLAGVFVAVGVAGSVSLARKLGAVTEGSRIVVDEDMATNVPGLFAAGDCTGGLKQIVKAVHEGAVAGMSAVRYLRGKR